eukprot:1910924-Prymnesium_polylepis.1
MGGRTRSIGVTTTGFWLRARGSWMGGGLRLGSDQLASQSNRRLKFGSAHRVSGRVRTRLRLALGSWIKGGGTACDQ